MWTFGTTNPTMCRRWANIARPTITRRHAHSKCIRWPNVGSTSTFRPLLIRPCTDVGPTLTGRPSPNVTHTQNAYVGPTLARRRHSDHDQSDHAPTLGQRCSTDHHRTSRTLRMHTLAQRWLDVDIPTATNPPTLGQRCSTDHHRTSRTLRMHTLAQRWLDVDIPTATNPTMRRRWANVAQPTITRRRVHSECISWPNVGSTSAQRWPMVGLMSAQRRLNVGPTST